MAIQLMGLPQLRIQEQGLDAAPLRQAIAGYTAGNDQATQFANNQAVGKTAATGDLRAAARQAMGMGETDLGMQYQQRADVDQEKQMKRIASRAHAVEMEPDPARKLALWNANLKMIPGGIDHLTPEERDPTTGPKLMMAQAGIVVDPLERQQKQGALQLQQAQIGKLNREAAMGGETPSNVREWQYFNNLQPAQKAQYLAMKRAEQWKDTGTQFVNPIDPSRVIQKDVAGAERAKVGARESAEAQAKSAAALPVIEVSADRLLAAIDRVSANKNLDNVTGFIGGRIPRKLQGEGQSEVQADIDQIGGSTFLQAYNDLRGGGPIAVAESQAAKEAYNTLQTQTMGTAAYKEALTRFRTEVEKLRQVARQKASSGAQPSPAANPLKQKYGLE